MRTTKMLLLTVPVLFWLGAMLPAQMPLIPVGIAVAAPEDAPAPPAAAPAQPAAPDIHVTVDNPGEKRILVFANPWVLAIAGVGLLFAIVLIAMATRGGGTTIVRER
jgi:hypothetical protein